MRPWEAAIVVVAVDDSPAALQAVKVAVGLAAAGDARVCFVHAVHDGELAGALAAARAEGRLDERRTRSAESLLRHVVDLARAQGVQAEGVRLEDEPARLVLREARRRGADLVVIGRSDVRSTGRPYVGHVTRHVLEFSDCPVLVVPRPADHVASGEGS